MSDTVKNYLFDKAPKRLTLLGDKTKKLESTTHIIEFPGGSVEVSRCDDGSYWAHIAVNHRQAIDDMEGADSRLADVIDGRIDRDYPHGVYTVKNPEVITQVAIRIKAR